MTKANESILHQRGCDHLDGHLERALAGNATGLARAELEQHAKECAACAALLELGPRMASRIADTRTDDAADRRAIAAALASGRSSGKRRRVIVTTGLAAAALLLASLAGAQYAGLRLPSWSHPNGAAPLNMSSPPVMPAPAPTAPEATVERPEEPAPAIESKPKSAAAARSAEAPTESSSDLFAQANLLRRQGQDAQAIAGYRRLQQVYPHSSEATLSYATLGALLLQSGDAKGALSQFDGYIARGGPVLEEALAGRARALGQLGDRAGEARAWQSLLDRFPSSVHAPRARSRLEQLR